jgi:hypothetical protein
LKETNMTKKKVKTVRISEKLRSLIASAVTIGFNVATGYSEAVSLFRAIGTKNRVALADAGMNYKCGYVARYLSDIPAMQKRWGNLNDEQLIAEARDIYAKPYPESSKPNRRTELEHKACRAADVSLATAKRRAGLIAEKKGGRKPRPASNKADKAVPVDLVKTSPVLKTKAAANDYFATAAAALLATVNKNAKNITPRISTAVQELHAAMVAEGLIKASK